jgi:hypothetical protein
VNNRHWNRRDGAWNGAATSRQARTAFDASQAMKLAIADLASGVAYSATAVAIYGTTRG